MHCCGCRKIFATAGILSSSTTRAGALLLPSVSSTSCSTLPLASEFFVTLERSGINPSEEALWNSGVFTAEVHPDLPPARTMAGLLRCYFRRAQDAVLEVKGHGGTSGRAGISTPPRERASQLAKDGEGGDGYLVRTVPVQVSRNKELRKRLATAAGVDLNGARVEGCRPANALLLVSGSHPARRLPLMGRFLPDVYDELRLATSMRDSGHLPERLAFWAVANPMIEADKAGVERVRKKVELGADVIVTQPPLVWEPFERWLRGVHAAGALSGGAAARDGGDERARGKTTATRNTPRSAGEGRRRRGEAAVLVGLPVITSPKGLRFWLDLCGVSRNNRGVFDGAFEAFGTSPPTARQPNAQEQEEEQPATRTADGASSSGTRHSGRKRPSTGLGGENAAAATAPLPYGQAWLETTVSKLRSLHLHESGLGVAGMHVMAPGPGPRRRAAELARTGVFGAPPRREREK